MNAKQRFLQSISERITALQKEVSDLQAYYQSTSNLPDSFFETVIKPTNWQTVNSISKTLDNSNSLNGTSLQFGNFRKVVAQILADNGNAMLKTEIIKELERRVPDVQYAESIVRNSLSALRKRKVVRLHKPSGVAMKGGYWSLEQWWNGDKLKVEHQPKPYDATIRYLDE